MARPVAKTPCPVRLRMVSGDVFCARSMEVSWEDPSGQRHAWSSWDDDPEHLSWYEAEKLLPSNSVNISVKFFARGLRARPHVVRAVDRRRNCRWEQVGDDFREETFFFRGFLSTLEDQVDAVFEMKGQPMAGYVSRAWNAGREEGQKPEAWECWDDKHTRPKSDLVVPALEAADAVAPAFLDIDDPAIRCACATKRMCAAMNAMLETHRETITGLMAIDERYSGTWVGVNASNTASAGLGVAATVALFVAPPVGVALGVGSTVASGMGFAGDALGDWGNNSDLRRQVARDDRCAFAAGELLKEWMEARAVLDAARSSPRNSPRADNDEEHDQSDDPSSSSSAPERRRLTAEKAMDHSLKGGVISQNLTTVAKIAQGGRAAAHTARWFPIAGTLVSTGFAVRGWSTRKGGQKILRAKLDDIRGRMLRIQQLVACVGRLECSLCAEAVILFDNVRRCQHRHHIFHASCFESHGHFTCPECQSPLLPPEDFELDGGVSVQQAALTPKQAGTPKRS